MDIQNEILRAIELMVEKSIEKHTTTEFKSVVEEIDNDLYKITYEGHSYWVKDGVNCSPTVGSLVWLRCPNGIATNPKNLYICAKIM